jgi:transcription elongation factor B subunit 1
MATGSGQEVSKWVTLVSCDGFEFVVLREAACISGAIRRMLDPKSTSRVFAIQNSFFNTNRLIRWVCGVH